jgi:Pyridoxamine 5'-phosphate oxidase
MLTWGEFQAAQPEKAATGRALLYQVGVGLGFLATVRADGGPRVHPVCPILTDDGLYLFVVASPKRNDLRRDPRYALHAFPTDDNEDAFYVTGVAEPRPDPVLRPLIAEQYFGERDMKDPPDGFEDEQLFELLVDHCLVTKTTGHGDWNPQHSVWKARG